MKNYHSLLMGFMKMDGWPRSDHVERSGGQTGLAHLPVPPSTGHKCHVISEEHEVEVDNINEMMVDNKRLDSALAAKLFKVDNAGLLEKGGDGSLDIDNSDSGSRLWNKNELIKTYSCSVTESVRGTHHSNILWDTKWNQDSSEIKSGLLVLIQSQNNFWDSAVNPALRPAHGCALDKIFPCQRCPVLVQIHQKSFQRYAIITRAGHRPTSPSLYLKLRKSKVTTSNSCPCQFLVTFDDSEGQSYRFEASNRQSAQEWIKAFTTQVHNFPLKTKMGLEMLPEAENEEPAVAAETNACATSQSPSKKRLVRQNSLTTPKVMPTLSESVDEEDSHC